MRSSPAITIAEIFEDEIFHSLQYEKLQDLRDLEVLAKALLELTKQSRSLLEAHVTGDERGVAYHTEKAEQAEKLVDKIASEIP